MKKLTESIKLLENILDKKVILKEAWDNEETPDWDTSTISEFITNNLGMRENQYSGSADWAGMPVWSISGNKYTGLFLVIDDNEEVVLLKREFNEDTDENEDTEIKIVSNDYSELKDLLEKIKKQFL